MSEIKVNHTAPPLLEICHDDESESFTLTSHVVGHRNGHHTHV